VKLSGKRTVPGHNSGKKFARGEQHRRSLISQVTKQGKTIYFGFLFFYSKKRSLSKRVGTMKKTPLYDEHVKLGAKIIDFGGWMMPVQYTGIKEEHNSVRSAAGLFDVSHMGEITVKGKSAFDFIQNLVTNDIANRKDNQAVYSPMCYEDGGTVDDVLVYRFGTDDYLIVVNASNIEKDYEWMKQNNSYGAVIENVSDKWAQIAIQGPLAQEILQKLTPYPLDTIKFFRFAPDAEVGGIKAIISRSGYTGEDGFEVYIHAENAAQVWRTLLEAGEDKGLIPVGLGARDTLRFEAALPLYGHELSSEISPLEAELSSFVKLGKESFIGKEALEKQAKDQRRVHVGFEMIEPGVPRNGFDVTAGGVKIGFVTSGSYSPSLERNLGMAVVESAYAAEGTEIAIAIRNKNVKARIISLPFYTKKYKK
jgi:aminomethyltransferase